VTSADEREEALGTNEGLTARDPMKTIWILKKNEMRPANRINWCDSCGRTMLGYRANPAEKEQLHLIINREVRSTYMIDLVNIFKYAPLPSRFSSLH